MPRSAQKSRRRRQHVRRPIRVAALVRCRGRRHRVTILDYSRGGLKIEGTVRVMEGERVTVELMSGDRLPLLVAWALGSHIGLQFIGPISPGNLAMVALDRAAEQHEPLHPRPAKA